MVVTYHKNFIKNFKKRFGSNPKIKTKYEERLRLFIINPENPLLKNHMLVGNKINLSSFSVTGDIRVVYKKIGKKVVFLDIGTHSQVY